MKRTNAAGNEEGRYVNRFGTNEGTVIDAEAMNTHQEEIAGAIEQFFPLDGTWSQSAALWQINLTSGPWEELAFFGDAENYVLACDRVSAVALPSEPAAGDLVLRWSGDKGQRWSDETVPNAAGTWKAVAHDGRGLFVAVSAGGSMQRLRLVRGGIIEPVAGGGDSLWMDIASNNNGTFLALKLGDGSVEVWKSIDSGVTWSQLSAFPADSRFPNRLELATDRTGKWLVKVDDSLWRTVDDGVTWEAVAIPASLSVDQVLTVGMRDGLWLAHTTRQGVSFGSRCIQSTDDGLTWRQTLNGLPFSPSRFPGVYGESLLRFAGGVWMLALNFRAGAQNEARIYRSHDDGNTWREMNADSFLQTNGDKSPTVVGLAPCPGTWMALYRTREPDGSRRFRVVQPARRMEF